ncbi:hypothetical protein A1OE_281 [Candidatus Endolissoclinum faulkneri L2]|uniref:Uncharacterized protein n=1 Tax=Candidatus Endolissoclinum faulkneri L2 TaxID=1193729 RepID=K7ZCD9_9PROT|nr:hypothetical protein A1OE_281 [Candidatus Endolissoclinum faulkneri L2]
MLCISKSLLTIFQAIFFKCNSNNKSFALLRISKFIIFYLKINS